MKTLANVLYGVNKVDPGNTPTLVTMLLGTRSMPKTFLTQPRLFRRRLTTPTRSGWVITRLPMKRGAVIKAKFLGLESPNAIRRSPQWGQGLLPLPLLCLALPARGKGPTILQLLLWEGCAKSLQRLARLLLQVGNLPFHGYVFLHVVLYVALVVLHPFHEVLLDQVSTSRSGCLLLWLLLLLQLTRHRLGSPIYCSCGTRRTSCESSSGCFGASVYPRFHGYRQQGGQARGRCCWRNS